MDAASLFFAAQDAAEAGRTDEADELWSACAAASAAGSPDEPPTHVIHSMALNGIAELRLDDALAAGFPLKPCASEQRAAHDALEAALQKFPGNPSALMNAALLARDEGRAEHALKFWERVAREAEEAAAAHEIEDWYEDWVYEPLRSSAPLARLYRALLLSQLGSHAEATPELQRLGYRWRLAPGVWDCARSRDDTRGAARSASAGGGPVRVYSDAVSLGVYQALRRAFAPGAPYWRETHYETASADKHYTTFYVDLDELRARSEAPANAIDRLLYSLLPLTGRTDLKSCEWWVHQRAAGRGIGHELHYDCEEGTMERSGRVLHPAVSSVLYLSGAGDPTLVLEETIDSPLEASAAHIVHPRLRDFLTFDGELLHGVLPGPFAHAGSKSGAPEQRLTLLVAWYAEHTRTGAKRKRLGAMGSVPRPSRSQTWPRDLELTPDELAFDAPAEHKSGRAAAAQRLTVPRVSPAWVEVERAADADRVDALTPPASARQHFFLQCASEVADRLREEHGIGGTWTDGAAKRSKNQA